MELEAESRIVGGNLRAAQLGGIIEALTINITHYLMRPFSTARLDLPILLALILFLRQNQLVMYEATSHSNFISHMQATGQELPQLF